ncbi:hypothetical protein [Nocardioides coralli]|uniref:hypothetical protein n=1 Tax=Nocardioides coralli TaxID=2872154 RepID=UPI001CA42B61|nr:hypothetical protein [Nocardioides coralli]QZY27613.1 hypothetical protein K6T13_08740 [Nocardioides coralli]
MTEKEQPTCSARGCATPAVWALRWNNPRLHTPERRKTWLACDEHRGSLSDFLGARNFLRDVVPVTDVTAGDDGSG